MERKDYLRKLIGEIQNCDYDVDTDEIYRVAVNELTELEQNY